MKSLFEKPRRKARRPTLLTRHGYGLVMNKFGTANKLRCLVSALRTCEHVHSDDDVFDTLLETPLRRSEPHHKYKTFSTWRLTSPSWNPLDYNKDFHGSILLQGCRDKEVILQRKSVDLEYFNIPKKLRKDIAKSFKLLHFSPEIMQSAMTVQKAFANHPCAGVAIRSWVDCVERQHLFNLEAFDQQIKRLHPDYSVFLTCDSPELEAYIVSRHKRRIVTSSLAVDDYLHPSPPFNTLASHKRALRELILLSSMDLLIGSYMSTFIETAWWLGGADKPVYIV